MFKNTDHNAFFGSLIATISGYTLSDWGAIFGILFGLFTILINWYYKQKEFQLKEKMFQQNLQDKEKNGK